MPDKHTWRCPICGDEQPGGDHRSAATLTCEHKDMGGNRIPVTMEWVPPEDWVEIEKLGGWVPKPKAAE